MSKFKGILGMVSSLLGGGKAPAIPAPVVPAAPAPVRREDTGASLSIGSDAVANQRLSGSGTRKPKATGSVGLGTGSGLRI